LLSEAFKELDQLFVRKVGFELCTYVPIDEVKEWRGKWEPHFNKLETDSNTLRKLMMDYYQGIIIEQEEYLQLKGKAEKTDKLEQSYKKVNELWRKDINIKIEQGKQLRKAQELMKEYPSTFHIYPFDDVEQEAVFICEVSSFEKKMLEVLRGDAKK